MGPNASMPSTCCCIHDVASCISQVVYLDPLRKFQWLDGQAAFAFGKWKGVALAEIAATDIKYMVCN
jgi:hypothetical protein